VISIARWFAMPWATQLGPVSRVVVSALSLMLVPVLSGLSAALGGGASDVRAGVLDGTLSGVVVTYGALVVWWCISQIDALVLTHEGMRAATIQHRGVSQLEATMIAGLVLVVFAIRFVHEPSGLSADLAIGLSGSLLGIGLARAFLGSGRLRTGRLGPWVISGRMIRWQHIHRIEFLESRGRVQLLVTENHLSPKPGRRTAITLDIPVAEVGRVRDALEPFRPVRVD
jgi:hypothetical protein